MRRSVVRLPIGNFSTENHSPFLADCYDQTEYREKSFSMRSDHYPDINLARWKRETDAATKLRSTTVRITTNVNTSRTVPPSINISAMRFCQPTGNAFMP